MNGILADKGAVIFAATGEISAALANECLRQGARLFLSARNESGTQVLRQEWHEQTDRVTISSVDATDSSAVRRYFAGLRERGISIDLVFNGIGVRCDEGGYGSRSTELSLDRFLLPLDRIVGSQFLTATAAAEGMKQQGSGVIITLTASLARQPMPFMAGVTAACHAIEGFSGVLRTELAPAGVRVLCVRVGGIAETRTIRETMAANAATQGLSIEEFRRTQNSSGRIAPLTLDAVARAIAWLASDRGAGLSARVIDVG